MGEAADDIARRAERKADAAKHWSDGHDRLCEERYRNIENALKELKKCFEDLNKLTQQQAELTRNSIDAVKRDISEKHRGLYRYVDEVREHSAADLAEERNNFASWKRWFLGMIFACVLGIIAAFIKGAAG